jgi:hypothetical protein
MREGCTERCVGETTLESAADPASRICSYRTISVESIVATCVRNSPVNP